MKELIQRHLPELIYGANDGIITTFAIIAGVMGANLSTPVVVILGVANLLADGISMGASKYLSSRSQFIEGQRVAVRASREGALATFAGFQFGGLIPLLAFFLPIPEESHFFFACLFTGTALFGVGAARSLVTEIQALTGGLEMLGIGSVAAGVAYGVALLGRGMTGGV